MNSNQPERLGDLTVLRHDHHARQGMIVTAIAKHLLGASMHDAEMLDDFLEARGVSPPARVMVKAAIEPGLTSSGSWAAPLGPSKPMMAALAGAIDRDAVIGKLDAVKVPLNTIGATLTAGATASWVGESRVKPVSALQFGSLPIGPRKLSVNLAVSAELLKVASIDVLRLIEQAAVQAIATELDVALLDPANTGIADVKPPSLTSDVAPIAASGDLQNQAGQVLGAISGGHPVRPVLIASLQSALRLSALHDLGAIGVRVLVASAAGNRLIAIDAAGVAYADGGADLRVGEPTIEFSTTPTNPVDAATVLRPAWQHDLKVVRVERAVTWGKRSDAVAYLNVV